MWDESKARLGCWSAFCGIMSFATRNKQVREPVGVASKVPAVTLGFWIIKIFATTLGETGGDTLSMTYDLGYLVSSVIFVVPLLVLVAVQIRAQRFHPLLYWSTIVASTTAGTTMADFATRSLGVGYAGGALLLFGCVLLTLAAWRCATGSIAVETVRTTRTEAFYWLTITFSQTLGTALGDWAADDGGLGYLGAAALFGGSLLGLVALRRWAGISPVALFWTAFILTRPLGATLGDFLDKPLANGGLDFSRPLASLVLCGSLLLLVLVLPQRAGRHTGKQLAFG